MTLGLEEQAASEFIYGTLVADSTLGNLLGHNTSGDLWDGPAPENTVYPIIRFDNQSAVMALTHSAHEVWSDQLWLIRVVGEGGSFGSLIQAARRVHDLLHRVTNVTVASGQIVECHRETGYRRVSVEGARQFRHLGGIYRLRVQ